MTLDGPIGSAAADAADFDWAHYFSKTFCHFCRMGPSHLQLSLPLTLPGPILFSEVLLKFLDGPTAFVANAVANFGLRPIISLKRAAKPHPFADRCQPTCRQIVHSP